jgi:iron complex outermembrane receptor protein
MLLINAPRALEVEAMKIGFIGKSFLMVLAVAVASSTYAQAVLEEVIVTARKRAENLQEVPISVVAFTAADIQSAGIQRPVDYLTLIPNVTIVDTANVGDTQVSIRGIVSTRDAEGTFAYVVDGVLITNPNAFNEELVDIEQIEVLKGPQGALYGRNAVAGAILVNTRIPTDEFYSKAKVGIGNNNSYEGQFIVSGGLSEGTLAASLTGFYRDTDGFYRNDFTEQDDAVDYLKDWGLRGRMIWNVNDNMTVDFRAATSKAKGGAINFNAVFAIPLFAAFFNDTYFADVNDHDFIFAFNVPGENKQKTNEFSVKADWELDSFDVTAIAAYNDLDEYLLSDGTSATFYGYELTDTCQNDRATLNSFTREDLFGPLFQPFGVLPPGGGAVPPDFTGIYGPYTPTSCDGYQYQERNQQDFSFELRLTSPEDQKFRWIAGAYYLNIDREVVVAYGADTGSGFLRQPYIPPTGPNPTDLLFWDNFDTDVWAVYGQLEFDLGDSMELALALRYDKENRKVSNKVPNVMSSGLNINLAGQPINPAYNQFPNGIPDRKADFSEWQPKISWRWSATDNANIYASWGRGFRSGGFNSIGSEATIDFNFNTGFGGPGELVDAQLVIRDEYDKEVTDSWEIGAKTMWADNRFRLNGAFFSTTIDDNQFFEFFVGPFGLMRVVTTIDKVKISGFEADFDWAIGENFRLYGGLGLLDSKIKKNINRPLSVGNDVPQAPGETFNLGGELNFPISDNWNMMARVDWRYVGKMWFHTLQDQTDENGNVIQTPTIWQSFAGNPPFVGSDMSKARRDSYNTLNARLSFSNRNWILTAWGRNLTDENYLQEVIPAPEFGGSFIHPSSLRAYGVEVTYQF